MKSIYNGPITQFITEVIVADIVRNFTTHLKSSVIAKILLGKGKSFKQPGDNRMKYNALQLEKTTGEKRHKSYEKIQDNAISTNEIVTAIINY